MRGEAVDRCGWLQVATVLGAGRVIVVGGAGAPLRVDTDPEMVDPAVVDPAVVEVVYASTDPCEQQSAPFALAFLDPALATAEPEVRRAAVHQAVLHLDRGGALAMGVDADTVFAELCDDIGLVRDGEPSVDGIVVHRRSRRTTIHDLLWDARASIGRVAPAELAAELAAPGAPIVVDTRTHTDRCRDGAIAGSIHVPRTVLEWHLDPANGYPHPDVAGLDQPLVVVCNGGYSSSLAAASLVRLGFTHVRDLIGGVRGWIGHGFEVEPPDHAHLDL